MCKLSIIRKEHKPFRIDVKSSDRCNFALCINQVYDSFVLLIFSRRHNTGRFIKNIIYKFLELDFVIIKIDFVLFRINFQCRVFLDFAPNSYMIMINPLNRLAAAKLSHVAYEFVKTHLCHECSFLCISINLVKNKLT